MLTNRFSVLILSFVVLVLAACPDGKGGDENGGAVANGGNGNAPVAKSSFGPERQRVVPLEKYLPRQDFWMSPGIGWMPFDKALFDKARSEEKLIVMFEGESVMEATQEYAKRIFTEEGIADEIANNFLPTWIDRDRYPGVCERYQALNSYVPSVLIVHPTGPQVVTRTPPDTDKLVDWLKYAQGDWSKDHAKFDTTAQLALQSFQESIAKLANEFGASLGSDVPLDSYDKVLTSFFDTWKPEETERNSGYLFSKLDMISFLLDAAMRDNVKARDAAATLLTGMIDKQTDPIEGGLFSYVSESERQNYTKRLDANSQFVTHLAQCFLVTGDPKYKDTAKKTLDFMLAKLGKNVNDRLVAFSDFQAGDQKYFSADAQGRAGIAEPAVDPTIIAQYNFMAIEALVWAHFVIDDSAGYLDKAASVADHLIAYMRGDNGTFARYVSDPLPKLRFSVDQIWAAHSLLLLYEVTGINEYKAAAVQAQDSLKDKFWAPQGGIIDTELGGPGLLSIPFWPLGDASLAARNEMILGQMSKVTGEQDSGKEHLDRAKEFLSVFSKGYLPPNGYTSQSARYAMAARELGSEPLDFHLLFKDAPAGEARSAIKEAFTVNFPYSVMEILTVGEDDVRITELGYTTTVPVWVYLCFGGQCAKVSPGEVGSSVERLKKRMVGDGRVYSSEEAADAKTP